ncbi:MFS transporter [Thalassobacillus hwangdonensis]|uniref:MFS transporter n=1 Tax=Thalassobacillus hwangdonensis TaxID=546108 RepID=A0ABW3L3V5_9BACI
MSTLFKNKGYVTLMVAQAISGIGDWLSVIAVITLVGLKWEATPMEVSFIILCLAVPMALLGPVAGTVADRFNRKNLMILSDVVRAGLIMVLTFAHAIWVVYLCLFFVGILSAVFIPAKNGKLKELVDQEQMKEAMSVSAMIDSGTKVMGPIVSGVLVIALGAQLVFIIDSMTFILSAMLIALLPVPTKIMEAGETGEEPERPSFKKELVKGVSFIRTERFILTGLFFMAMSLLLLQLSDSQIIVLIRELTAASPDLFGYTVAASGIGMFIAGLILSKKTDYNALVAMLLGVCGIGLSFGMMGVLTNYDVGHSLVWMIALGLFAGLSASFVFIPFQATVQVNTPVDMTGRVFGVINSVTTTATIIGPLLGGWLSTWVGVVPTFILTASLLIGFAIAGLLTRNKLERRNQHVTESEQGASAATSG